MEKFTAPISIGNNFSDDFKNKISIVEDLGGYIAGGAARGSLKYIDQFSPVLRYDDIDFFLDDHANYSEIFSLFSAWFQYKGTTDYNDQIVDNFLIVDRRIQLVKTNYMPPAEQIDIFDISVCKAFIFRNKLYMTQQCLDDCGSLTLHYNKQEQIDNKIKLSSIIYRLQKYLSKGFFIEAQECLKIIHCIKGDDLKLYFAYGLHPFQNQIKGFEQFEKIIRLYNL